VLRLTVIVLVAFNLVLAGLWLANRRPGPEPQPAAIETARDSLPTIVLMREMEPAPEPLAGQPQCFSLGPFETESTMRLARGRLEPLATGINERTTEALMELGYWVEMASLEGLGGPAEAVRTLRRKGLEDVAVISGADGGHKVSLGYFLEEKNARERVARARDLGFAAEIRLQRETQPRYWLDYVQAHDAPPASPALADTVPANLHRQMPCGDPLPGPVGDDELPAAPPAGH